MDKIAEFKNRIPDCQTNMVIKDYTTMGVGGVVDIFLTAKDISTLTESLKAAIELDLPYLVLGNGSNIIFSDKGFPGLVVINKTDNVVRIPDSSQILVDSGTSMAKLISECIKEQLTGLEFFAGIPGTVGGAVYGNVGFHGIEISSFIKELTVFHPPQLKDFQPQIITHDNLWMGFTYHSSKLKEQFGRNSLKFKPVILTVKLGLAPAKKDDILERIRQSTSYRGGIDPFGVKHSAQPKGVKTCGCIFRNPGSEPNQAAGYLLDQAGMKRKKVGAAYVASEHANFVINRGTATASEIRELIEQMRSKVRDKYQVNLEEEIEYLGQW